MRKCEVCAEPEKCRKPVYRGRDGLWTYDPRDLDEPENAVDHPKHYTTHPSGVECIQITEHMSFTLGNAVKYIWRADLKGEAVEDLKKAAWYINREIEKRTRD